MISVSTWLLSVSYGEGDLSSAIISRGGFLCVSTARSHGTREYYRMGLKAPSAPTMGRKNPPSDGAVPPLLDHRSVLGPLPTADHIAPTRSTPVLAPLGSGGADVLIRGRTTVIGESTGPGRPATSRGGWTQGQGIVHPPRLAGQQMLGRDNPTVTPSYNLGNTGGMSPPPASVDLQP